MITMEVLYEKAYDYLMETQLLYDFEKNSLALIHSALAYEYDDIEYWRDAIINHYNHQKYIDNKNGNPHGRFGYYWFANRELKYLNAIFNPSLYEEYENYMSTNWKI